MASKERQEKYRNNRRDVGDTRLCVWISKDCKDAIEAITEYLHVSQKHFIENMVEQTASALSSHQAAAS